eukprot:4740763-Alexandrium_andersonii.AAC.1
MFPQLLRDLLAIAMSLLVERRLEGQHARIKQFGQHALGTNRILPSTICAKLRLDQICAALRCCSFRSFLDAHWRANFRAPTLGH